MLYRKKINSFDKAINEYSALNLQQQDIFKQVADLNVVLEQLKELEKTYREISLNTIDEKLNSDKTLLEVADKAARNILTAFNKELAELKSSEQKTIIEALKSVLIEKNILKVAENEFSMKRKFSENAVFHDKYNALKNIVKSDVIPMIVGPAGSGKSHAVE